MMERCEIAVYNRSNLTNPTTPVSARNAPEIVKCVGQAAEFAWEEFFQGEIAKPHTRKNYIHAVKKFLAWCEARNLQLNRVTPGDVGAYFQEMPLAVPTKKLHLAAQRKFFDRLVNRHVIVINPAATVRAERYSVVEGKTPEIRPDQVARLLTSIDVSTKIGLRDRAVLAVLIYRVARVGAVANLTLKSVKHDGIQYTLRFSEKGGKSREIPVRHDLELAQLAYMEAAAITEGPRVRTAAGKTEKLTENPMTGIDICRMLKRRLKAAGFPGQYSPHSFRVATVTDLLEQNVELESVEDLAGHSDPRTTRLYDRRRRKVTRNIVERISLKGLSRQD
jgi:integrase/recombinase XerD